jgi:hypothetical protein
MLCYACSKSKNDLQSVKSNLITGQQLFLCQMCIDLKHEPRWVIILHGRQNGPETVREYVIKKLYTGKPITAEELIA